VEQSSIDSAARAARDAGINAAMAHADRVEPKWSDNAYTFLVGYAREHSRFTTEEVRTAAASSVATPPDSRAWGGVMSRARRDGLITHEGFTTARDPKVHCNVIRVWRSL